jgi:hypothetical protein
MSISVLIFVKKGSPNICIDLQVQKCSDHQLPLSQRSTINFQKRSSIASFSQEKKSTFKKKSIFSEVKCRGHHQMRP